MNWAPILTCGSQATEPNEHLVRFVSRNYFNAPNRSNVRFLDIGSGRNANNTSYLIRSGFNVTAIDSADGAALAHIHRDIREVEFDVETFDCIIDINTLCHVENPPLDKIKLWLKSGGKLFSIAPSSETSREHLQGKGFCRCTNRAEIYDLYRGFEYKTINSAHYCDIHSWIIKATK